MSPDVNNTVTFNWLKAALTDPCGHLGAAKGAKNTAMTSGLHNKNVPATKNTTH